MTSPPGSTPLKERLASPARAVEGPREGVEGLRRERLRSCAGVDAAASDLGSGKYPTQGVAQRLAAVREGGGHDGGIVGAHPKERLRPHGEAHEGGPYPGGRLKGAGTHIEQPLDLDVGSEYHGEPAVVGIARPGREPRHDL